MAAMATLTVRNLDDELKTRLRVDAARHGRSMEEHARVLLRDALADRPDHRATGLGSWIHSLVADAPDDASELELPGRAGAFRSDHVA